MKAAAGVLRADHTHLYPGARLHGGALKAGATLLIEFADLGSAGARVEAVQGACAVLAVDAHRTARGTAVAAKRWLLAPSADESGGSDGWRVLRRLPAR